MKRIIPYLLAATLTIVFSCSKIDNLESRVSNVETELASLKGQIAELKSLIDNGMVITSVTETSDGYTITLSNGQAFNLKHGTNGSDGQDGDSFIDHIEILQDAGKVRIVLTDGQELLAPFYSAVALIDGLIYVPEYTDGKATILYSDAYNSTPLQLTFEVYPASAAAGLSGCEADVRVRGAATRASDDVLTLSASLQCDEGEIRISADPSPIIKSGILDAGGAVLQIVISDGIATKASGYCELYAQKAEADILGFTALEQGSSVGIEYMLCTQKESDSYVEKFSVLDDASFCPDIEYSFDKKAWTVLERGTQVSLDAGQTIYVRGHNPEKLCYFVGGEDNVYYFVNFRMTGKIEASGSIMSLVDRLGVASEVPLPEDSDGYFYRLFKDCDALVKGPSLTAAKVTDWGYNGLFGGCTSLKSIGSFDATRVGTGACNEMFKGCSSLETAPELPATRVAANSYYRMFSGCTSLKEAPALPATQLVGYCYYEMFRDCTSLVKAPELPATQLHPYCYCNMFRGCSALKEAPALRATTLANACYYNMFRECGALVSAPDLPATELAEDCYLSMFNRCTALEAGPVIAATHIGDGSCYSMFCGCTALVEPPVMNIQEVDELGCAGMFYGCTSLKSGPQITTKEVGIESFQSMFSDCSSLEIAPQLPATELSSGSYMQMFYNCTSLVEAPALPATALEQYCYSGMFWNCTSLVEAPELPALSLATACYHMMFLDCASLEKAPDLPAEELTLGCYNFMFKGCTKLNYVKALFKSDPNTTNDGIPSFTYKWLEDVSSEGTFVRSADSDWSLSGVDGIPEGWTVETI